MTSPKTHGSNSAIVVDFNTEMSGIVNGNANALGRELKLACAIYSAQEHFPIADLVSVAKVGKQTKRDRQLKAASANCVTFANIAADHAKAKKAVKKGGLAGFEAKEGMAKATKLQNAALAMFDRACMGAYFMLMTGAVIESKPTDKSVKLRFTRSVDIGDVSIAAGETNMLGRSDIAKKGKALATAKGLVSAKPASKEGAGVETQSGATTATVAGELAKAIGALTKEASDDFVGSATSSALLGSLVRKLFVADGQIVVSELLEALRSNDALTGVAIVNEVKPAPRKSVLDKARAIDAKAIEIAKAAGRDKPDNTDKFDARVAIEKAA